MNLILSKKNRFLTLWKIEDVKSAYGMHDTWMRLINESKDVTVRNLTFAEPIADRNVHNVLPAIAKIYARLRSLGCPVYRMHSDRAREFLAKPVHQWCLDRGIVQTMTPGSAFKTNGRAENEVGMIKKGVRTLISAGACPLDRWPLAVRHVGERRPPQSTQPSRLASWKTFEVWLKSLCPQEKLARSLRSMA